MKVVLLAAGKGVRMRELTKDCPKPLLKVAGKTLLEHKMDFLPASCEEIIIITGYLGQKIKDYFGNSYKGIPIRYVDVSEILGTAHALWKAQDYLADGSYIVMAGDDLYHKKDIEEMMGETWALHVAKISGDVRGGKVVWEDNSFRLKDIIEGAHSGDITVATSFYTLQPELFNYQMVAIGNGEYGLPQTLVQLKDDYPIKIRIARQWLQVGTPEDIVKVDALLRSEPRLFID